MPSLAQMEIVADRLKTLRRNVRILEEMEMAGDAWIRMLNGINKTEAWRLLVRSETNIEVLEAELAAAQWADRAQIDGQDR